MRHQKKRYVLLSSVESFMVPCVLYGHRGNVTLGMEPETCITIFVVTARAGSDVVAGSHKLLGMMYGYPDLVLAIEKFDESRVLGPALFNESARDMQYWYRKEFMEWLTDPLSKKVTVSTVNCKLKELCQLQGIYTHVYHPDLPIHDSQHISCTFYGQFVVSHTGFAAGSRTEFQAIFPTISMRQA